jgi:hypothetical protein
MGIFFFKVDGKLLEIHSIITFILLLSGEQTGMKHVYEDVFPKKLFLLF